MKPLYLLILLNASNHVVFTGAKLCVLLSAVQMGASPMVVGLLIALFSAPVAFTSVAMGRWADRKGARVPMLFAALAMSAGAFSAWAWQDIGALFIVSLLVGTFYNAFVIGSQQQVGRHGTAADRVGNFSLSMQSYSIANFIAPLLTGFAIDAMGHAGAFLLLALLPLASVAVLGLNRLKFIPGAGLAVGAKRSSGTLELLRPPLMRRIFVAAVIAFMALHMFNFLMPIHGTQLRLSASEIGLVVGSLAIANVVVRGFLPALTRRFGQWPLIMASVMATAVGLMAIPFISQVPALMAVSFLSGLVMGVAAPVALALMHEASPPEREGEVLGLRLSALNGIQTIVPLLAGMIGAAAGTVMAFVAVALMLLLGAWYMRAQWPGESAMRSSTSQDRPGR